METSRTNAQYKINDRYNLLYEIEWILSFLWIFFPTTDTTDTTDTTIWKPGLSSLCFCMLPPLKCNVMLAQSIDLASGERFFVYLRLCPRVVDRSIHWIETVKWFRILFFFSLFLISIDTQWRDQKVPLEWAWLWIQGRTSEHCYNSIAQFYNR